MLERQFYIRFNQKISWERNIRLKDKREISNWTGSRLNETVRKITAIIKVGRECGWGVIAGAGKIWGEMAAKSSWRRDCPAVSMCRFVVLAGKIERIYKRYSFPLLVVSKCATDSCIAWHFCSPTTIFELSLIVLWICQFCVQQHQGRLNIQNS